MPIPSVLAPGRAKTSAKRAARVCTERAQQQPQRVTGRHRLLGHTEQIEEEHPTGKARPQHMGGPDGQRGFPHAPELVMRPTTLAPGGLSAYASSLTQASSAARPAKSSTSRGSSHTSRTCPVILQPTITRQLNELLASILRQHKRIRQSGYGPVLRPLAPFATVAVVALRR
jgi:hypothetical protein